MTSIIDSLNRWAQTRPDSLFCSFLDVHGRETESYTYATFQERTRFLAEHLSQHPGVRRGNPVLLVYPPGLEIIAAFLACARIGALPVPAPALPASNLTSSMAKLRSIADDSGAHIVLTTEELGHRYGASDQRSGISARHATITGGSGLEWVPTDCVQGRASPGFRDDPGPILFIQYTSGSTSDPKGVVVSHENVIHNCRVTIHDAQTAVSWLPQYHDMGLIGYYLYPLLVGGTVYGFSPRDFLKRPILWLETLSQVRASYSSAPNFGFEYCLREDKLPSRELRGLDLSSVGILMNASESVSAKTYSGFIERFSPYGLRPQTLVVAYGLAENTLAVTHYGRRVLSVNKRRLQEGMVHTSVDKGSENHALHLMSCGRPLDDIDVRIVDPDTCRPVGPGHVGEIWVAGKSMCQGYWRRPDLSREVFANKIAEGVGQHTYLRTMDLGFLHDGELFVCGRIKDLIIVRGVNHYPEDIERIVESTSPKVRRRGVAAFSAADGFEGLIIVVEVKRSSDLPDARGIAHAVRRHCDIEPHTIVFVSGGEIARTTSGKIRRGATRRRWLDGEMRTVQTYYATRDALPLARPLPLREQLRRILEECGVQGNESETLAELGLDSLALVEIVTGLEQLLEERNAGDLVSEVDGSLLQRLTAVELFSLVDHIDQNDAKSAGTLRLILQKLRDERVALEHVQMRRDVELTPIGPIGVQGSASPVKNVLLTGPTGFFGPFLLGSLLRHTTHTYYALTRCPDPITGLERIRDALHCSRQWTPTLERELARRVRVVCGDLTRPRLGMREEEWRYLTEHVQAVIHNAAMVNYVLNYHALRPHNVEGTRELLRFSFTGSRKAFHLISSTTIFGWTANREVRETEHNDEMLNLDFGYAQSKWVAEQLVLGAKKHGLPVRVYRPSFISASRDGIASRDDIVIRLLSFMINHEMAVKARNQISLLPVDVTAENIVAIFNQPSHGDCTFHMTADEYYNMVDITRLISREYGYTFAYHDIPGFVVEMKRRCSRDDPLYPLLDFFVRSHGKLALMEDKRYTNGHYREMRRQGAGWSPEPPLKDTVSYLMRYMLREGIIPPSTVNRGSAALS